jgi:ketosteroid isomerase-like protein
MKTLFFVLVVSVLYAACTGTTSDSKENSDSTANASTTSGTSSISYPYTASFSSKISRGKDSNALLVLNSYKAWENGDMTALANTFSDSMDITFSDGSEFKGTRDSAIAMAKKYRDSLSSVKIDMNVWMPVHADDKNGDAVLAWYTETDTYKNGKVDSMYFHDINGIKDGKIDFIESYGRKAKK